MISLEEFKKNKKIGIVGGSGRMGKWALRLFKKLGYNNLYFSYRSDDELENEIGAKLVEDNKELAKIVDLLIISVPISKTINVINEVGPHLKEGAIFSDFTSVKKNPCEAMAKYSKKAIGLHPMFKDSVVNLKGKNIVITPTFIENQEEEVELLKQMFEETGAKIRIMSPEKHDKIASFNQAGIHFLFLTYGHLLKSYCRKNDFQLKDLEALDTPNSHLMNILLGRFLATSNYEVMWGIQNLTKDAGDVRKLFIESAQKVFEDIEDGDREQFENDLTAISRKFKKSRLAIESEDSDKIIDLIEEFSIERRFDDLINEIKSILEKMLNQINNVVLEKETDADFIKIVDKIKEKYKLINDNFDKKIKDSKKATINLRRLIDKTLLSGTNQVSVFVKKNRDRFESINILCDKFVETCNVLEEIKKILPDSSS